MLLVVGRVRGEGSILVLLLALLFFSAQPAPADEDTFSQPAYWGGTGLMEIPNARVIGDGVVRAGVSDVDPFRTFYGTIGYLPGLEINGRVTRFDGVPAGLGPGYGAYKDKAADLKYQVLEESKYLPALAVGMQDIHGTRLLKSRYIVADRQIYPFNFTLGYGLDRLDGLFGGIECEVTDELHLLAEYNPIDYRDDRGAPFRAYGKKPDSPVNVGARYRIFDYGEINISYQRGEQLGVMAHVFFPLGENLVPWKPDPPYYAPVDRRPLSERGGNQVVETIRERLENQGFFNVRVLLKPRAVSVQYENGRYLSEAKALGRVLRTVVALVPAEVETINLYVKRRNLPLLQFRVKNEVALAYFNRQIDTETLAQALEISNRGFELEPSAEMFQSAARPLGERHHLDFGVEPAAEGFFNDPTGFFKFRISADPWAKLFWWDGFAAYGKFKIPLYSDIETSNPPLEPPIRTDVVDYKDEEPTFERLVADQVFRVGEQTFGRVAVGYQELQYAGVGGELLHVLGNGRLSVGVSADYSRKREPGFSLGFRDLDTHTLQANLYWKVPEIGLTTHLYGGRFMAGDKGGGIRVTREFDTGAMVTFWYTYTDTSDFTSFNKDYRDKGVAVLLPARVFYQQDMNVRYRYALSPWTRDVGQLVHYWNTLTDFVSGLNPSEISERLEELRQ